MLPNKFGTRIISANDTRPFGTRIISANAPKSIWNTYSKRKCHAACRPASQPASQPASRHKNLDFRGCPGSIAKPTQIDPLGALLGPGEQFPILYCFGGRPCLPAKHIQIDLLGRLSGHGEQIPQTELGVLPQTELGVLFFCLGSCAGVILKVFMNQF